MNKRERFRKIRSIHRYLEIEKGSAFDRRSNEDFDWYGQGQEAFECAIQDKPITRTQRVVDLATVKQ